MDTDKHRWGKDFDANCANFREGVRGWMGYLPHGHRAHQDRPAPDIGGNLAKLKSIKVNQGEIFIRGGARTRTGTRTIHFRFCHGMAWWGKDGLVFAHPLALTLWLYSRSVFARFLTVILVGQMCISIGSL